LGVTLLGLDVAGGVLGAAWWINRPDRFPIPA
jgi:hypothetical protein